MSKRTPATKAEPPIEPEEKPVEWVGSSREDLKSFPRPVRASVGESLYRAQTGQRADGTKIMKGFGGAGVIEIIEDHDGSTYRAVYTVKFRDVVYVLHCFQKKSKSGIETPKHVIDRIKKNLKRAEDHYKERSGGT